ncbi:hypothetical protein [Psychroflexus sediminis]|uniref:Uncharacterized protein n=1 Tax=Psychroflexus sediminis TaxID=470826 RepID=A0A1G7ZHK8_9FLAO|nr:hypothetical protein [Psychroflexus sediminis]SDH08036.1 hypothetical protein SAMN04488027_1262 [Psychroflexus sediminis]
MKFENNLSKWNEIAEPVYEKKEINFPNENATLYVKSKNWGITGNHKNTVISTNPVLEFQADSLSEYVFQGFSEIIYKTDNDTLTIYSHYEPTIPSKFDSKIKVEFIKIRNNTEWNELKGKIESNYQIFE